MNPAALSQLRLSPALTEAELMSRVLERDRFADWLGAFLPELGEQRPEAIFTPAIVSDGSDALIAHLHGLNLFRAYCWNRIAEKLQPRRPASSVAAGRRRSPRRGLARASDGRRVHAEHWLACYATLLLT